MRSALQFKVSLAVALVLLLVGGSGCRTQAQNGALIGGLSGAGLGGVIGHQFGLGGAGAALGGLAGAATGTAVGQAQDIQRRHDAIYSPVVYVPRHIEVPVREITNVEVMSMTESGLSDQTIIDAIRRNGGRFYTSPDALIVLKQRGVSEAVIQEMLRQPSHPL